MIQLMKSNSHWNQNDPINDPISESTLYPTNDLMTDPTNEQILDPTNNPTSIHFTSIIAS